MPTDDDQLGIKEFMQIYSQRLDSEHTLISSRMSWLLTLDSFLVAILGVALVNTDKLPMPAFAFWPILVVAVVGALTNSSCLFSNYWGARAIDETSLEMRRELATLAAALDAPEAAVTTDAAPESVGRWLARLRLYGRDPGASPVQIGFWHPPSGIVHPWFLVPLVFIATFACTPLVLAIAWRLDTAALWFGILCLIIGPGVIGAAALADLAYNRRRSGLAWSEYRELRRLRAADLELRTARDRARAGEQNRSALEQLRKAMPAEHA